ncbi:hypothetical protein [Foetidibacter luteolus]|uniref:hypothetical protein n=1 Tax=Foetidibacter luteolus TaxID=2608880 RepID=UPI00129B123A|nr:hypothetical protein [Foetidibacter luteolus]
MNESIFRNSFDIESIAAESRENLAPAHAASMNINDDSKNNATGADASVAQRIDC